VDKLSPAVLALIDTLKRTPPSAADVEKVKAQMQRTRQVDLKQNGYWLSNIVARDQAGEELDGLLAAQDALIAGITPASIQAAARKYFDTGNYYRFVLLPEAKPAVP
jgi:zinc protease